MLANGRTRPTLFPNNQRNSSEKSSNFSYQFSQRSPSLAAIPEGHENGVKIDKSDDQLVLDELKDDQTISRNNNNKNSWPSKMATVNTGGPGQQLTNTNGFPMPLVGSNKTTVDLGPSQPSPAMNNQVSSNIMDNMNPTSSSMISGGENSNNMPSSSQFNAYNSRQDLLLQGFRSRNASHDINPMMRAAPNTSEQYGSPQQRSYMSGSNDSSLRGLNRQTQSPFPPNYFPQESHNNQTVSRVDNTQTDDRNSSEQFQWQQALQRSYPPSLTSNPSPASSHSHSPMQQSGMPPRQPPPYMMMGQPLPPPSQSPQQYMVQSQMKTNAMATPPYYGGMGSMMQRQQGLPNQMQKPPQEYGAYQQQQFYSQQRSQFPSSLPPYMQSRQQQQQPMPQSPSNMPRMMPTQQPILPKPSMEIYSRYPNNMSTDHGMEFQGPVMNEHMQQQPQHRQQQSYPSPGGVGPDTANHRGYYPGYPSSPSPNVTMGSPLRSLPEGFPNNSASIPTMPGTPTYPNTPPSSVIPFSSGTSTPSNAAAAAAAAVMQAANARFPPSIGHPSTEQSSHGYSSHDNMTGVRGRMTGPNAMPSVGIPGIDGPGTGSTVETGRVQSPTLNMLPTAEDVEAMIQSMSSEETCLDDTTPQSCPPSVPSSTTKHELANDSLASASPAQNVNRTTTNTSPLSSFSEGFSGVPSPGVSISSLCDDDNDDMNVPVDDITPTLGQSANVMVNKQINKDTPQFGKYSQLYELTDELERKEFLDKYASFMESTGNTVKQVPVFNNQLLDIYKLYKVIKANGGLQEVVKRKLWDKVLMSLNISPDQTLLSNQLRNHYSRFLLAYEMADVTKSSYPTANVDNLFDDTGIPPPNATVTCSEVLFPAPTMSVSSQPSGMYPTQYGQQQQQQQQQPPPTANGPQGYGGYNYNEGYMDGQTQYDNKGYGMTHNTNTYNMPPYSTFGNERTSNYTNYQGFPTQPPPAPQPQFPGSAALSQLLQQRNPNMPSYPSMINQPRPQQDHPMWSQYKASTEPEHMFDYPPKQHYASSRQPYPPTPPQYRQSPPPPPHGARSPSLPRQPVAQMHQPQVQVTKPKFQANHVKKDVYFPLESVEATKPVFTKKRKLTSRDLGPVEAWRVMMSLKSGLLSETTWALDALSILLYDDHTVGYFLLSHLPGLLDNLLDHFRRYLVEIFGPFWEDDNEEDEQKDSKIRVKEQKSDNDERLEQDVCRSLTASIAASSIDYECDKVDEWWLNSGQTTLHIQTHLGTDVNPKRRKQDENIVEPAETNCKLKLCDPIVKEDTEVKRESIKTESTNDCAKQCCDKPIENCVIPTNEWDLDSDESSSDADNTPVKDEHKNDSRLPSQEEFTARLQKELDLDIEPSDDTDTNAYIRSVIETRVQRSKNITLVEEESIRTEESTLSLRTECDDALSRRVMCISNILRGLSFVPGNDVEMFRHSGLLLILGKLLLLYHDHAKRVPYRHSFMQDDVEVDAPSDDRHDWWWSALEVLRENALVIFSNIAGQLDLCVYPKAISAPILDGLLHWFVCQSAEAIDPMPTATVGTSLSAQQLVLEALAKMSILGGNTERILTTPSSQLEALYATLIRLLGQRDNPVSRELSLVVLSNLSQSDSDYACLTDKKQCIAMLLQFIEDAANSINAYSSGGSLAQAGFHSEDFCGTSVDMLRRAASTLVCLARCKPIRSLFLPYQERLLLLTTLKLLERMIGPQLADVLYYLSR